MTSEDFRKWQERLGLSDELVAECLGVSASEIALYRFVHHIPEFVAHRCEKVELAYNKACEEITDFWGRQNYIREHLK
jgi:hypothetical protein